MKKTILVIEDDRDILDNMVEFLESEGYETKRAVNGKEALDLLSSMSSLPSVIVLDLMMPVMDGFKFREEQKKDPRIADIPILVMSAAAHIESNKTRLGAVELIRKPINIETLSQLLKKI